MADPTVWAALATPLPATYAVTFIDVTNVPTIDVANFYYTPITKRLYVATASDYTGVDSINFYKSMMAYLAQSQLVQAGYATVNGIRLRSSRGTGLIPALSLTGDFLGATWGEGYSGTPAAFAPLASVEYYARGVAAQLGGEIHYLTRADGGAALVDRMMLDNAGNLAPTVNAGAKLGKANVGWGQINLDFTNTATIGAVAINKPAGSVNIAAAASSVVVTNSLVTVNSLVIAWLMFIDATLTFVKSVVPAAGSFTITGNAAATANTKVGFLVINTDS
jgi:hypothetical protein